MAQNISLATFPDPRGVLTVIDRQLPFPVRRAYFISGVPADAVRGGHRHHRNRQVFICLRGSCEIYVNDGTAESRYKLCDANHALLLETTDWHQMRAFSPDALLLVLASESYDVADYIDQPYP